MRTGPVTPELLRASVIAVPPLARTEDYSLSIPENRRIIEHIEKGGIRTLLYGGNANLYHLRPEEYGDLLEIIAGSAAEETLVIPSAGPTYGTMMYQAPILAESMFPTAMILPMQGLTTSQGVAEGIRHFVQSFGRPVVVYIKNLGYLDPEDVARLTESGHVSFIKYAIVREDPAEDPYLNRLVEIVDPSIIVSGIGEQPAGIHREHFRLTGYTSGCVCLNPELSQEMLRALNAGDIARADTIRKLFEPLEDLRNSISPVRVLHEALHLAGIANTGPHLPLLSRLNDSERKAIEEAACNLMQRTIP